MTGVQTCALPICHSLTFNKTIAPYNDKNCPKEGITQPEKRKEKPLKFSFNEQKEYEEIDGLIAEIETQLKQATAKIEQAFDDYILLQELIKIKEELELQLQEKMDRWVYLNELAERISDTRSKKPD